MELYLKNDDIFRTILCILKENEKSGRDLVTSEIVRKSKDIYNIVVIDIINKVMSAKIKEDNAVNQLMNKLFENLVRQNISTSMKDICKMYIMQASVSIGISDELQREYFGLAVQSIGKFTDTIHRYIHGPRGGTTGYYAYNYDRLAIASYVCLEKGFKSMTHKGVEGIDSVELELIIRKVRRDICRYGKLAGVSESYKAYIDYGRLCSAYDTERLGRGKIKPWGNNFENYSYSYKEVRDAIDEVLGAMPIEVNEFVQG